MDLTRYTWPCGRGKSLLNTVEEIEKSHQEKHYYLSHLLRKQLISQDHESIVWPLVKHDTVSSKVYRPKGKTSINKKQITSLFSFLPVYRENSVQHKLYQFCKIPCYLPTLFVRGVHHFNVTVSLNVPSLLLPPIWLSPAI